MTATAHWDESLTARENIDLIFAADLETARPNVFEDTHPAGWDEWSALQRQAWLETGFTPEELDEAETNATQVYGTTWTDFQQEIFYATDLDPTEAARLGVERACVEPAGWEDWTYFARRSYLTKTVRVVEERLEQIEQENTEKARSKKREANLLLTKHLDSFSLAYLSLLVNEDKAEIELSLFLDSFLIRDKKAKSRHASEKFRISSQILSHPSVQHKCRVIAGVISRERGGIVEVEDLMQEGIEKLYRVLSRDLYQPSVPPGNFMAWAARVMENRMRDFATSDYRYTIRKAQLLGIAEQPEGNSESLIDLIACIESLTGGREFVFEQLSGETIMSKSQRYKFKQRARARLAEYVLPLA